MHIMTAHVLDTIPKNTTLSHAILLIYIISAIDEHNHYNCTELFTKSKYSRPKGILKYSSFVNIK